MSYWEWKERQVQAALKALALINRYSHKKGRKPKVLSNPEISVLCDADKRKSLTVESFAYLESELNYWF
jgi:hypothetical protein